MGRNFVYRRPWSRFARKFKSWKRFITAPPAAPRAGDAEGFIGPAVRALAAIGPSVDGAAAIAFSSRAAAYIGPSADAGAAIQRAADGRAHMGDE